MTSFSEIIQQNKDKIGTSCGFDFSFGESVLHGIIGDNFIENSREFHFSPHNHAFYELQLVLNGPVFVRIQNKEYMAQQDSLCIIHPYEYHTYLRPKDLSHQYQLATFSFFIKDLCAGSYQGLNLSAAISALNNTYNIPDMHIQLLPILAQISLEFQNRAPGYRIAVADLLKLLLIRIFQAASPQPSEPVRNEQTTSREIIIDKFYTKHYMEAVTVSQLSQQLHVSDRRTNQLIHQLYGCSFSEKPQTPDWKLPSSFSAIPITALPRLRRPAVSPPSISFIKPSARATAFPPDSTGKTEWVYSGIPLNI